MQDGSFLPKDRLHKTSYTLAVPKYDKPMDAWLHLFENEEARLVFSNEPPDSPKHPIARSAMVPPPEGQQP